MSEYRVNVFDNELGEGLVIGRVRYNSILDFWDGRNWTSGPLGMHKGLTKLKDGSFVLIIGTQWEGEKDYAYTISPKEALNEILKSGNVQLLDQARFKKLKELCELLELENEYEDLEEE